MPASSIPTKDNPLVALLGDKKIWINWTLEPARNTDDTPKLLPSGAPYYTKIPRRLNGSFASVSDPDSWSTYPEAAEAAERFSGVGIVFEDSLKLVGVDLDHYLVKASPEAAEGKLKDDRVFEFLVSAATYSEVSPSGTGLHVFFQMAEGEEPFDPIIKKHHDDEDDNLVTEIYSRGRYFTFTGHPFGKTHNQVRTVTTKELNGILSVLGYPWGKTKEAPAPIPEGGKATAGLEDEVLLQKMFSSKNGAKVQALWDGGISENGNDRSSADMALVSHLAFWTRRDPVAMKRLWLSSPLGNREKTQKRPDYQDRTIENAIKNCKEVYTPASEAALAAGSELEFDDYGFSMVKGTPQLILDNICRVFEKDPRFADKFRLNSFSNFIECRDKEGKWINLLDYYIIQAQREIANAHPYFSRLSQDMTTAAVKLISADNAVNPPVDWLRSLKWDNEGRLDHWLFHVYGTPDDDLHQSMGANFVKGMVQRIITPGCQMDLVLCLEGAQGTRKSSSLRALGGDWFAENVTSVDSKDDMIVFAGSILVEFSEGAVLNRASIAKLKSVITTTVDKFRPPYERGMASFPRGCVFSMSVNDSAYLKDETGGRRFLIVKLEKVADVDWLKANRDQLFAEALYRIEVKKETAYEFSETSSEELRELQESRTEDSAYDETVIDWYLGRTRKAQDEGYTLLEIYREAINTGEKDREMNKQMENSIRSILRRALYLENRVQARDENGKRARRWVPTEKTIAKFKLTRTESIDGVDEFDNYDREVAGPEDPSDD